MDQLNVNADCITDLLTQQTILMLVEGVRDNWSLSWICTERWGVEDYAGAEADKSWSENPFQGLWVYLQLCWWCVVQTCKLAVKMCCTLCESFDLYL